MVHLVCALIWCFNCGFRPVHKWNIFQWRMFPFLHFLLYFHKYSIISYVLHTYVSNIRNLSKTPEKPRFLETQFKQECISVGCVPPAAVAVWGGFSTRYPPRTRPPRDQNPRGQNPLGAGTPMGPGTPAVNRHTPVNILPCPKLRLRAVKNHNSDSDALVMIVKVIQSDILIRYIKNKFVETTDN